MINIHVMAQTVRAEVEKLLADMRAKADTLEEIRATVFIQARVRDHLFPEVPESLLTPMARAAVLGAWVEHDARQRGFIGL